MAHAHYARRAAAFLDAGDQHPQDSRQRMPGDGLEELDAKCRADADHHVAGVIVRPGGTSRPIGNPSYLRRSAGRFYSQDLLTVENIADRYDLVAPCFADPVAGT